MVGPAVLVSEGVERIGGRVRVAWVWLTFTLSVVISLMLMMFRRSTWRRTVRREFMRQVYFTGARAMPVIVFVAVLVGLGMVSQALLWLRIAGQSEFIGQFLALVLVREIAPLLANLILLGRSGMAIASEVGTLKASGQIRVLEAQGLDPLQVIVLPRAAAMSLCVLCLCIIFISMAVLSGFALGRANDVTIVGFQAVVEKVLTALGPGDALLLLLKTLVPGFLIGVLCSVHGLGAERSLTDVPRLLPIAFVWSMTTVFLLCGVISFVL